MKPWNETAVGPDNYGTVRLLIRVRVYSDKCSCHAHACWVVVSFEEQVTRGAVLAVVRRREGGHRREGEGSPRSCREEGGKVAEKVAEREGGKVVGEEGGKVAERKEERLQRGRRDGCREEGGGKVAERKEGRLQRGRREGCREEEGGKVAERREEGRLQRGGREGCREEGGREDDGLC